MDVSPSASINCQHRVFVKLTPTKRAVLIVMLMFFFASRALENVLVCDLMLGNNKEDRKKISQAVSQSAYQRRHIFFYAQYVQK